MVFKNMNTELDIIIFRVGGLAAIIIGGAVGYYFSQKKKTK